MIENKDKIVIISLSPKIFISPRHFRTLICFNLRNRRGVARNPIFCNRNNCNKILDENKHLDRDKNQLIKLKIKVLSLAQL